MRHINRSSNRGVQLETLFRVAALKIILLIAEGADNCVAPFRQGLSPKGGSEFKGAAHLFLSPRSAAGEHTAARHDSSLVQARACMPPPPPAGD
jgi:hypothetical protein